jgi:hypothetical protein
VGGLSTVGSRPFVAKSSTNLANTASAYAGLTLINGIITIPTGLFASSIITAANFRPKNIIVEPIVTSADNDTRV